MTIKAIIFDVDGTLADTEDAHRIAFNTAFAENNLDLAKIQSLGCNGDYINSVIASYSIRK